MVDDVAALLPPPCCLLAGERAPEEIELPGQPADPGREEEPLRRAREIFERLGAAVFLRELDAPEPVRPG